jgi:hypothetical protein
LNELSNASFRIELSLTLLDLFKKGANFKFEVIILTGTAPIQSLDKKRFLRQLAWGP